MQDIEKMVSNDTAELLFLWRETREKSLAMHLAAALEYEKARADKAEAEIAENRDACKFSNLVAMVDRYETKIARAEAERDAAIDECRKLKHRIEQSELAVKHPAE